MLYEKLVTLPLKKTDSFSSNEEYDPSD